MAQICGFLEVSAGDIREAEYDFGKIWRGSPLYEAVRDPKRYEGKCGICRYLRFCGGCRARAFAETGNYLAEEPHCTYRPMTASAQTGAGVTRDRA
jgi:radical SAM protein with 4Fe4S-binding SPASM domain